MNRFADAHFALHHPVEIAAILDRLQREQTPITVEFAGHAIASSLLEVRRDALVFDLSHDDGVDRQMFTARTLVFVSELDHILIAFETGAPSRITLSDGPAAAVGLPNSVTRLQRREWFRAALPLAPPVRCTVMDPGGTASAARAVDLSGGGAGLLIDDLSFEAALPGSDHALILTIPDVGSIQLEAELRTVGSATHGFDGKDAKTRLGFRFEDVPARTASQIQRYVQHVEVHKLRVLKHRD